MFVVNVCLPHMNGSALVEFLITLFRCGYPAVNASYYDLSFHPVSSNNDCKLYKNSRAIRCYSCDSCK
uniref:Uncharacterized protein n=1 Tax=Nelumbo nucifera TaxID=4432 RepID=A0A822ZRF5_NELNU|nr:TPA_asm: hypothetical protein HUJ06_017390 [Nelumbo nucifera]